MCKCIHFSIQVFRKTVAVPSGHQLIDCLDHVRMAFTLSVVEAAPSRVLASAFPQGATRSADAPHKCLRLSFSLRPSGRRYKTAIE